MNTKRLVRAAMVAAIYVVLCLVLAPFSYGAVQVRLAEMLCLLPVFGAEYIVAVTLGCFLANLLGSTLVDVVFGTAATLVATFPLAGISRFFAITHRAPVTLFLLCAIFPLVPGAGIYYTAYYLLNNEQVLFASKGVETLKTAVALAMGIAIVCSIPLPRKLSHHQYRGPKMN